MTNKINSLYDEDQEKKKIIEEKTVKKYFINFYLALFLVLLFWWLVIFWYNYSTNYLNSNKTKYIKSYWDLSKDRTKEVSSEVKKIITNIWDSSNLVYNLSLFHVSPVVIINEVEKAIYLWPDTIVTDQNITIKNYSTISFWLITEDLVNFATLIKKLKKLYSSTFDVKWLHDFNIVYEQDKDWRNTWKVFYTTKVELKYLKDTWVNSFKNNINSDSSIDLLWKYDNNQVAFETFKDLTEQLAQKRKDNKNKQLYVTSTTKDDSIFLSTDLGYRWNNLYYITSENTLADLFSLSWIWSKSDYSLLKSKNIKLIFETNPLGTSYWLCTKVVKEDQELTDLERANKGKIYTKIISTWKIDWNVKNLCNLL